MSALRTSLRLHRRAAARATLSHPLNASTISTRSFQTSRVLAAGKESALHHEGRAEEAEQQKQEQLQKQKEGKGHWHEGLASDSESIVKADRSEISGNEKQTIDELQKESAKLAEKEQK